MVFKRTTKTIQVPTSPDKLLLDLPRRKIPDVLPHQREVLRTYASKGVDSPDVAMQMATGSGKTLVGLLIGEWLRRKKRERVVYLCPTVQLVNQAAEQAEEKYGLSVLNFTGSASAYDPQDKAAYRTADHVAITTYSSLFNTNPYFHDADVVILDDAHASENYVSVLWSVRINSKDHDTAYKALRGLLKSFLGYTDYARLSGKWKTPVDCAWVDMIPVPVFEKLNEDLREILDTHADEYNDVKFPWRMIREHLLACQMYLSSTDILIRPLIPPVWAHAPFSEPRQRIYMSATLGSGGDLERLFGRRSITRLPVPDGWDRQGVGRRFFIFPSMSLNDADTAELHRQLISRANRALVLVPNKKLRDEVAADIEENLRIPTFSARDIEASKKRFISEERAVAIVAGRYDGIDFPGDECRLLCVRGLPKAVNLQEQFLMSRMGANLLFNDRIQTRVLQAIGRCTRSLEDFSAVVVSSDDLTDYLTDNRRRKYLHPELQAEIDFGVEQSKGVSIGGMIENFETFLDNDEEWEEANDEILSYRKTAVQKPFPAMGELRAAVASEVYFQEAFWQEDYEEALGRAEEVLGQFNAPELRGYRALWHYLAGSAAWLGPDELIGKARLHFNKAKTAATGVSWLVKLAQYEREDGKTEKDDSPILIEQLEHVEFVLAALGTAHDRAFANREKAILKGLNSTDKGPFEEAHRLLGEMLGFNSRNEESEGSPDPWWFIGNQCFVFEDHSGAQKDSAIGVNKARQVASHPNWIRQNQEACRQAKILPVLVTPVRHVKESAQVHLEGVSVWPLDDFCTWANNALATIRKLRSLFFEPGNLVWRGHAADAFIENKLDAMGLKKMLGGRTAALFLKPKK